MKVRLKSWRHVGDTVCLSAAMQNLKMKHPDWEIWYSGNYDEMFFGSDFYKRPYDADKVIQLAYNDGGAHEKTANRGNVCESYTYALSYHLGEDIPLLTGVPVLPMPEEEMQWAEPFKGCVTLNTNCQQRSSTKGYPYWQKVAEILVKNGEKVVLMGGTEERDIKDGAEFKECIDLRGQTSIRQLMALAIVSSGIISPASGIVHISAAYDTPCLVVIGAREPKGLTEYPFARHITTSCQGRHTYGEKRGCMHFVADASMASCERAVEINGRWYPQCMAEIQPERIVDEFYQIKKSQEKYIWQS